MSVASLANTSIVVQRPTVAASAAQGETLATVFTGKARIQPLSGAEINRYSRDLSSVTAKAYVAGTPDIKADDIMTAGSDTYLVKAVRDIDLLGRFTTIELEEQL